MVIKGGYIIKARSLTNSDIMRSPPYVREVWDWLLMNVNHRDNRNIKRGQLFTTLDEICEGLCWYVGYRKVTYTKDSMKKAMKALKKASMIATTRSTRGILITVCNYEFFQDPKNYESTNESTTKAPAEAPRKHHESPHVETRMEECKNKRSNTSTSLFKKINPVELGEGWQSKPLPADNVIEMWNEIIVGEEVKRHVRLTEKRKQAIARRSKDALQTGGEWVEYFQQIRASSFCMGEGGTSWKAGIDWALVPENIAKVLEGNYEGKK